VEIALSAFGFLATLAPGASAGVTIFSIVSYNKHDNLREKFRASCCKIDWQIFYRYKQQFRDLIVPDATYKRDDHS
jgi:hypothetical protein